LGSAVADERCTVDRVMGILAKDPPLTATMVRLANSALLGGDSGVTDLRTAVMRLGFDAILSLGRTAAVIRAFRSGARLDPFALWRHSVAVGLVAKGICGLVGRKEAEETAYLAGLLHDIGKFALDRCFTEEYAPVAAAVEQGFDLLDAEEKLLGLTHAQVGAMVAVNWSFPSPLVEALRDHHQDRPSGFLSALLQLSDLLVRTRIPNTPADENLAFVLTEQPAFGVVFAAAQGEDLDVERLTFSIDDELEHAVNFVKLAFQD
jgi:putative nucleotidyltransferase with HDIG domain